MQVEKAMRVEKGDVIIIRSKLWLDDAAIGRLKERIREAFKDNRALILTGDLNIAFTKPAVLKELRDQLTAVLDQQVNSRGAADEQ